jgi:hypothetical protein
VKPSLSLTKLHRAWRLGSWQSHYCRTTRFWSNAWTQWGWTYNRSATVPQMRQVGLVKMTRRYK